MPSWKKVIISGSDAALNSLTVTNGATVSSSLTLSGSINNVDYIDFKTSATATQPVAGRLSWNNSDGTLDLGMKGGNVTQQIGQETFYEIRNETTSSILNGTSLYANGVTAGSGRITAAPFVADGSIREVRYLGLATEDISTGVNGFVTYFGYVRNLDTRGTSPSSISVGDENWSVGDILYAHPTVAGKLTNVRPKHEIIVAIIIIRNQTSGVLFVRPSSYGHLDDIHDVNINTGSLSTGDLLIYDSGSGYWVNSKQLSGSYGLTGSLNATSFTGSLFGTASFSTSASYAASASQAITASFVTPLNQNVIITGSLTVITGSNIEFQVTNTGVKIGNLLADNHTITGSLKISGSLTTTGDIITQGNLIAQQYIVSSSVSYFTESFSSGSTKFGDSIDDTHQFTGSVNITGSLNVNGGEIFAGRIDNGSEGGQVSFGRALDNNNGWYIDVYGNTSTPSLRFIDVSTAAVRMTISGSGAITMEQSLAVGPINPSAVAGRIDASNDVVAFSTSDKRLKENIQPIPNALDKISKIGGYTFDWRTEEDLVSLHGHEGSDVGVIAQEIESILPNIVTTRDNGYKAVKYEKIVPLLIQCIKELKDEIDDLKSQK
jgi:phage baseplate assembly protein gpV